MNFNPKIKLSLDAKNKHEAIKELSLILKETGKIDNLNNFINEINKMMTPELDNLNGGMTTTVKEPSPTQKIIYGKILERMLIKIKMHQNKIND